MNSSQIEEWIGTKIKDPTTRPFAVIAKSSDICNYNCSYCYVEHNSQIPIMPIEVAETAIKKVVNYVGEKRKVNFIWHGGEPLTAGHDFFYKIADIRSNYPENRIENCLQTNGSLLTKEFLRFCKENEFAVSLSFDGNAAIHDYNRKDKNGRGTHTRTMKALEMIKEAELTPGCVCVLHKQNVNRVVEMYEFFKENGLNFRVNPVVRSGRAVNNYNALAIIPREYGNAMKKLFDLWFNDDGSLQVEPLHTIVGNFVSPSIWGCDYHGNCLQSIISINPDGSVYPCGRFAGLEQFKLGNIMNEGELAGMFTTELHRKLCNRNTGTVKKCQGCAFKEVCNTGCMITAHMARGNIYDEDYYCTGRKIIFAHVAKELKRHLEYAVLTN